MSEFVVVDHTKNREIPVNTRSEGEEKLDDFPGLKLELQDSKGNTITANYDADTAAIVETATGTADESESNDGSDGSEKQATPTEATPDSVEAVRDARGEIPEPSNLTSDPLEVISKNADQFTDQIRGKVVINRQGYAVLAERFNISVVAEPVTLPSETEFAYAEFRAIATTEDGQEYTGFGSASTERDDDKTLLAELAETRSMKRATAWATGVGMTAVSELENEL